MTSPVDSQQRGDLHRLRLNNCRFASLFASFAPPGEHVCHSQPLASVHWRLKNAQCLWCEVWEPLPYIYISTPEWTEHTNARRKWKKPAHKQPIMFSLSQKCQGDVNTASLCEIMGRHLKTLQEKLSLYLPSTSTGILHLRRRSYKAHIFLSLSASAAVIFMFIGWHSIQMRVMLEAMLRCSGSDQTRLQSWRWRQRDPGAYSDMKGLSIRKGA